MRLPFRPTAVLSMFVAAAVVTLGGLAVLDRANGDGTRDAGPPMPAAYTRAVLADKPLLYRPLDKAAVPPSSHNEGSSEDSGQPLSPGADTPPDTAPRLSHSFSVEVWAKLASTSPGGRPVIFTRGDTRNGHYGIGMSVAAGPIHAVHLERNGVDLSTARGLTTARYRQLTFTFDHTSNRWRWYVDGTPDTSGVSAAIAGTDRETAGLQLGALAAAAGGTRPGGASLLVHSLSIYPTALPPSRVRAHYQAGARRLDPPRYAGGIALGGSEASNARRPADYRAMRQANATWVRSDLDWRWLEETPGRWNWDLYDPVIADANAAGLNFLAILHMVPGWANGGAGEYAPPSDLSLLTEYCYQASRHYIPLGVTNYEIGNEVNLPHPGWSRPTGAAYTGSFLVPCVTGVRRAAGELNATVNIVLGSLVPTDQGAATPATFLADVYANGGQEYFDTASLHPYTGRRHPTGSNHLTGYPRRLHDLMTSHGDGAKEIWATEFGYPTGGSDSVSEHQQADYADAAIDAWYANSFAGPLFWYSARDRGSDRHDREDHFGLLRNDGSRKPAYTVLATRFTR
jgi:hypothetical protein